MPTFICGKPCDIDIRKWESCLEVVTKQMLADGWNKHAKKFIEVKLRKARTLFYKTK